VSEHQRVLVVTDSTADIPAAMARDLGIEVVPLRVSFGNETFRDGIDLSPEQFVDRLVASPELPKTSQPPVTDFEEVFRGALERGQDVVCITISADLSGTHNAARLAAESVDTERVLVVDSRATTMQQGWVVVAAARLAREGADAASVAAEARDAIGRVKLAAVLQTLDYVYKGGRIGRASQLVGSALGIKPVLSFIDGVLMPVERVRTWKKAMARVPQLIGPTPTDIIVLHSRNLEDAQNLAETFRRAYPEARVSVDFVGATILTYAGPGAIGVAALYPKP
jgi:DegV family protein with EDD domain